MSRLHRSSRESGGRRTEWISRLKLHAGAMVVLCLLPLLSGVVCAQQAKVKNRKAPTWALWHSYQAYFMDEQGRVIDHDGADRSTSEAQAYGMFFALVANDRTRFDMLLQWTTNNMAEADLTAHLPAWAWGRAADGMWHVLDANPASDADVWMSYTLLEAGRLWREPHYRAVGLALAELIAAHEVQNIHGLGIVLMPSSKGFTAENHWILNPSYSPLPVLHGMAAEISHGPWQELAAATPDMLQQSAVRGFAMDWVQYGAVDGFTPALAPGAPEGAKPVGSYDAIRVYLWAGLTPSAMTGAPETIAAVHGMADYMAKQPVPPRIIDAHGAVIMDDAGPGFSAALLPYLKTVGEKQSLSVQQNRLEALKDAKTGLYGTPPRYYDQNLALFADGWLRGLYRFDADGQLVVSWAGGHMSTLSTPDRKSP